MRGKGCFFTANEAGNEAEINNLMEEALESSNLLSKRDC